jgi:hypothetical protein
MMRLAPTRNSFDAGTASGGLLLRMRAWLSAAWHARGDTVSEHGGPVRIDRSAGVDTAAVVLSFPIRGEALLVKLATSLRVRIAATAPQHNPFLLKMMRAPHSRLMIDQASFIEYQPHRGAFYVVVEAAPDTTITLETTDFDSLVEFVAQYVDERLCEAGTPEVTA